MNEILLTDEEILEVLGIHGYTIEETEAILNNAGRALCYAQLQKVVEWLGNMRTVVYCQEPPEVSHICMPLEVWHALLKEIEE